MGISGIVKNRDWSHKLESWSGALESSSAVLESWSEVLEWNLLTEITLKLYYLSKL